MTSWLSAYVQYNRKTTKDHKETRFGLTNVSVTYGKEKPLDLWMLVVQIVVDIFNYASQFTGMSANDANVQMSKVREALAEIEFFPLEEDNAQENELPAP